MSRSTQRIASIAASRMPIVIFNIGPYPSPSYRPQEVYQIARGSGSDCPRDSSMHSLLLGQHFDSVVLPVMGRTGQRDSDSLSPTTWVFHQPEEESPATYYLHTSPRCGDRLDQGTGLPVSRSTNQYQRVGGTNYVTTDGSFASAVAVARENDFVYNHALGTMTCSPTATVLIAIPENGAQQFQGQGSHPAKGPTFLVDVRSPSKRVCVPGTRPHHGDLGHEPFRLGHAFVLSGSSGITVPSGTEEQHQLARVAGGLTCSQTLSSHSDRSPCIDPNGQYGYESTHQPRRGHSIQVPHG